VRVVELHALLRKTLSLVDEGDGRGGALEPSTEAEDLVTRGYPSGGLVQVQVKNQLD
jgi:hypothetical protein